MKIIKVTDNHGKTIDRYTVYFEERISCGNTQILSYLTLSEDPESPQGVSTYDSVKVSSNQTIKDFLVEDRDKEIELKDLPKSVLIHIIKRLLMEE